MAGSSNFKVFDENNLNIQDDATYAADIARQGGVSAGMASSALHNKLYRQATIMATALGTWMANQGQDVSDADLANLITVITNSIETPAGAQTKADAAAATGVAAAQVVQNALTTHKEESATESQKGHVELATAAETIVGTDSTRAVHPAGLRATTDFLYLTANNAILSGADLDTYTTPGVYYCSSSTISLTLLHCPILSGYFKLKIFSVGNAAIVQEITYKHSTSAPTTEKYLRSYFDGYTWSTWFKVITSADIPSGTGSPEGVITATVGTLYRRTDGGANTTLYVKESGTGNTGWVAK